MKNPLRDAGFDQVWDVTHYEEAEYCCAMHGCANDAYSAYVRMPNRPSRLDTFEAVPFCPRHWLTVARLLVQDAKGV